MSMTLNTALEALQKRLGEEMLAIALKAKDIFIAGTADTQQIVAYQIVSADNGDIRLNVICGCSSAFGAHDDITVYIVVTSGNGRSIYTLNTLDGQSVHKTDGGAGLDDYVPWVWVVTQEKDRLLAESDFPANTVGIDKTIVYVMDVGVEYSLTVGQTLQLVLDPNPTADTVRNWNSGAAAVATVTPYVNNLATGGLVTAVAAGETYVRCVVDGSPEPAKVKIIVT